MDIRQRFERVFQDIFDDDSIAVSDEMTAADIPEWDSLNHVQLVMALEKEFRLRFTTSEIIDLRNVGEFMALVRHKSGQ